MKTYFEVAVTQQRKNESFDVSLSKHRTRDAAVKAARKAAASIEYGDRLGKSAEFYVDPDFYHEVTVWEYVDGAIEGSEFIPIPNPRVLEPDTCIVEVGHQSGVQAYVLDEPTPRPQIAADWDDKSGVYVLEDESDARELYDSLLKAKPHCYLEIGRKFETIYGFSTESGK